MNPRLRGALVGALIGAGVGALYGFLFVAYRERMREGGDQLVEAAPPVAANGQLISPEVRDPERQQSTRGAHLRQMTQRAREIQQGSPGMPYRDAMRQAAEERTQQQEEA